MKAITIILLLLSLAFIYSQDFYGGSCDDKNFGTSCDEADGFAGDYTLAHHKVASCASLYPYTDIEEDDNPMICCYAKIKYKLAGEKFTRKVCEKVEPNNIEEEIDILKASIQTFHASYFSTQGELKDIDVSLDCKSKFLKYSALLFLIILF